MINKKFKPAVAAVRTGAILAGTAAYPMVTESYVQDAADHGLKVNTWTVNDWDRKGKVWKNRTLFFFCLYKRTETGIIIYKKKKNRRRHE